jgi:dihydroflavonol-4-reductase
LELEIVEADIRDRNALEKALNGVDVVYHLAAYNHMTAKDDSIYEEVNTKGTAILCELALKAKVKRFIYTSSATVIAIPEDTGIGSEGTGLKSEVCGPYEQSKLMAEREVFRHVEKGLDAIILNPTVPFGPGDINLSAPGQLIVDFIHRKIPAYIETGMNLVHVADVAMGHKLAEEKGERGERYILGNKNLYLSEVLEMLEKITGVSKPKRKIPYAVALAAAKVNHVGARALGKKPTISLEAVKLAKRPQFFDCSKARSELGLPLSDVYEALKEEVSWFREKGFV